MYNTAGKDRLAEAYNLGSHVHMKIENTIAEAYDLGFHVRMTNENTHRDPTKKKKKKELSDRTRPPLNFWPPSSKIKGLYRRTQQNPAI